SNGLQNFSGGGVFDLAAGMADVKFVADFQTFAAAHVNNQGIAAHVSHHAYDLNFARGNIADRSAELAANVGHGLRHGFTQQGLAKVGSMRVKAANACSPTTASAADQ